MLQLIQERGDRYKAATKSGKGDVAREILHYIKQTGGRFLRRSEGDPDVWEEVEYSEALKKVGHGIRDCLYNYESKSKRRERNLRETQNSFTQHGEEK